LEFLESEAAYQIDHFTAPVTLPLDARFQSSR
jgi:hypothetical protein